MSASASANRVPPGRRLTLVATILGSSIAILDSSVVDVALPSIQPQLTASSSPAFAARWRTCRPSDQAQPSPPTLRTVRAGDPSQPEYRHLRKMPLGWPFLWLSVSQLPG